MSKAQPSAKIAARAILIVLVIIGHNRLLRDHFYYSAYIFIYAFHVGAFFLLTALSDPRPIDRASLVSLLRRVVLPFLIFTFIYTVLAQAAGETKYDSGWGSLPLHYLAAASLANTAILDAVAGLKMLWFLPAFFVFCLAYNFYGKLTGWQAKAAIAIAVAAHALVGAIPRADAAFIPWGANIVANLLLPAILFRELQPRIGTRPAARLACILLFAAASAFAIHSRYELILADSQMPSFRHPVALIVGDLQLIFGTATCLILGEYLARFRLVRHFGENSLKLYLLHPAVNAIATRLFRPHLPWSVAMIAISVVTIVVTLALIWLIAKTPLDRRLFG